MIGEVGWAGAIEDEGSVAMSGCFANTIAAAGCITTIVTASASSVAVG